MESGKKVGGGSDSATSNAVELHSSFEILRKLYSELHFVCNKVCGIERIDRAMEKSNIVQTDQDNSFKPGGTQGGQLCADRRILRCLQRAIHTTCTI